MTPGRRVTRPSVSAASAFRKRRMLFIAPAAVVAVVMLANLIFQQGRNLGVWLGYVGGVVVVCGVILGTVVRRDARLRRDAPPDVLLEGFGRFRLDEWQAT